jgi:hypothetical protein
VNHPDDDQLRARFDQLRDDDRASVPPFHVQWDRVAAAVHSAPRRRRFSPVGLAAAAVLMLGAGIVVRRASDADRFRTTPTTISGWTSPTASLLHTSGGDLFAPPPLLSSALDGVIQTPVTLKGEAR